MGVIVILTVIVFTLMGKRKGKVHGAGVIMIGSTPIVFGLGPDRGWLTTVSLILAIVSIALFLIINKRSERK